MIICDIDGVLANFVYGVKHIMADRPVPHYSHPKECLTWDWMPRKEQDLLWERVANAPYFWADLPRLPEARDGIEALYERNVLYATSRKPIGRTEAQTVRWLSLQGLTGAVVLRSDKARLAKLTHAEFAIEDNPDTMLAIAKSGVTVYAPIYPYNAHVEHPNIRRYETLDQVFKEESCQDNKSC